MNRDWVGNGKSVFTSLGASNHSDKEREKYDYYATSPMAANLLINNIELSHIWEPACGEGHLAKVFSGFNRLAKASDIISRGYGKVFDFLSIENLEWNGDIVTNPPYKYAQEFIEKAMGIIPDGRKVAMFLKIQFLEGKRRKELYRTYPLKVLLVSSSRINCAMNGDFVKYKYNNAVAYGWFIWEKGYRGESTIKWIN